MLLWRQVTSQTVAHIDTTSVYSEGRLTIHITAGISGGGSGVFERVSLCLGAIMKLHGHDSTLVLSPVRVATAAPYVNRIESRLGRERAKASRGHLSV